MSTARSQCRDVSPPYVWFSTIAVPLPACASLGWLLLMQSPIPGLAVPLEGGAGYLRGAEVMRFDARRGGIVSLHSVSNVHDLTNRRGRL
ncbi:hypothetical protein SAMN05192563_10183 [Paraburkholderia aspalathi]|uniref:Uncharacterized protein n=1 Tax=Paraburkholderia aspalathi TaxID=1324617 RepID=A0A1I7EEC4_9BURK|nr:hypothetical protein SAMN05192563_10183 [Paraburkholderia aspalathi]